MWRPDGSLLVLSLEWIVGTQKTFAVLHVFLALCFVKCMPVKAISHIQIVNEPNS